MRPPKEQIVTGPNYSLVSSLSFFLMEGESLFPTVFVLLSLVIAAKHNDSLFLSPHLLLSHTHTQTHIHAHGVA